MRHGHIYKFGKYYCFLCEHMNYSRFIIAYLHICEIESINTYRMVNLLTKIFALQLINANLYFSERIKQYSDRLKSNFDFILSKL